MKDLTGLKPVRSFIIIFFFFYKSIYLNTVINDQFLNDDSYKDLFDNASDLIHFINLENKILYVNPSWLKTLGYTLEEIQYHSIYDLVQEADKTRFFEYREAIIQGKPSTEIIFGIVTKSGTVAYLEGEITLRQVDGQPSYTRGIFHNITSKIDSEKKIRESEQNLQQLLIHAPDAVVVIDADSNILYWNPKAEKMFGWKAEAVIGTPLSDKIVPERFRKGHEEGMRRFLATGVAHVINNTVDIAAINSSGFEFSVELTVSTTQQNGKQAFIAFIRDTSEKKKNQLELEKRKQQLENSNLQLQQFAHAASHDMKEPVRKILLYMDRVKREEEIPVPPNGYLDKINKAAHRLWRIVEGFLNYATVENFSETLMPVDLQAILKNIESDLELVITEKNARIVYATFPVFRAVPFLIYQLMYNLIANALKFSREGVEPVVAVNANLITLPGDSGEQLHYIEIRIKDNGIGFSAEEGNKLFNTFTRLNAPHEYEGSGFGLSLCRSIVERHNGTITANGFPGEGAVFTIHLPVDGV